MDWEDTEVGAGNSNYLGIDDVSAEYEEQNYIIPDSEDVIIDDKTARVLSPEDAIMDDDLIDDNYQS